MAVKIDIITTVVLYSTFVPFYKKLQRYNTENGYIAWHFYDFDFSVKSNQQ